jgi:hypothetical protein
MKPRRSKVPDSIFITNLRVIWSETRKHFWINELNRLAIDLLIGSNLTNEEVAAAKLLKIPTIEIQHGVFPPEEISLCWPNQKPDFMCLWHFIDPSVLEGSGILPCGIPHPYSMISSLDASPKDEKQILVALTWGQKNCFDPFGTFPWSLVEAVRELQGSHSIVFRPHPVFPKKRVSQLRRFLEENFAGAKIQDSSAVSLENALSESRACLCDMTSVAIDAVLLNCKVIVTDLSTFSLASDVALRSSSGEVILYEEFNLDWLNRSEYAKRESPRQEMLDWSSFDNLFTRRANF